MRTQSGSPGTHSSSVGHADADAPMTRHRADVLHFQLPHFTHARARERGRSGCPTERSGRSRAHCGKPSRLNATAAAQHLVGADMAGASCLTKVLTLRFLTERMGDLILCTVFQQCKESRKPGVGEIDGGIGTPWRGRFCPPSGSARRSGRQSACDWRRAARYP